MNHSIDHTGARLLACILAFSFLLSACAPGQAAPTTPAALPPTPILTATPERNETPTAPEQSEVTAPVVTPTITFTPPPPAPTIPVPTQQIRILLMGSDIRADNSFRTDIILLLTVNPAEGTATVLSFPRDLYVYLPWGRFERINTVQYFGFDTMADTLEMNFGVRPQYYMVTNFAGFVNIIDGLGGIDVEVGKELSDQCDLPSRDAHGRCTVKEGTTRMDGQFALWYVRSRYSTDDMERLRRSQEVLMGVFKRLLTLDAIRRAPEIYHQFSGSVETNLDLTTILSLGTVAPRLAQEGHIRRYALSYKEAMPFIGADGANLLFPNLERIRKIIEEAVGQP